MLLVSSLDYNYVSNYHNFIFPQCLHSTKMALYKTRDNFGSIEYGLTCGICDRWKKSLKWEDSEAPARNPKSRRLFYKRGSLNSKEGEVKVYTNQTV